MLTEYIEEALKRAHYEIINDPDEPYYGEVPELPGVWANAKTLEIMPRELERSRGRLDFVEHQEGASPAEARRHRDQGNSRGSCVKAKLTPVSWQELVQRLRALGFHTGKSPPTIRRNIADIASKIA